MKSSRDDMAARLAAVGANTTPSGEQAIEKCPTLPEKPADWSRELVIRLNFGEAGGAASYRIKDADGMEMPFSYGYDSRKEHYFDGFLLDDKVMKWKELVAYWPDYVSRTKEQVDRTAQEASTVAPKE